MARPKKKYIIGFSIIGVIIIVIVILSTRGGNHRTTVETEIAGRQNIVETVTATGRIEPRTQVKISADVAAKITYLGVN